jgi:hypothetical protein
MIRNNVKENSLGPENDGEKWVYKTVIRLYLLFSMGVFLTTALAKLFSNFSDPRLAKPDPFIHFLSSAHLMVAAATLEILVVIALAWAFFRKPANGIPIVMWLCGLFALYRIAFALVPERADSCKCLGAGSFLGKLEGKSDTISAILLGTMLLGGVVLLLVQFLVQFLERRQRVKHQEGSLIAKTTGVLTAFLLLHAVNSNGQGSFSPAYVAQGIIKEQAITKTGELKLNTETQFAFMADAEGHWQMSREDYIKKWDAHTSRSIAYNGTDIFSAFFSDKLMTRSGPVTNLPPEQDSHPAEVCRGPFPIDFGPQIGLLWIAFCGGEYISQHPTQTIPCVLFPDARTDPPAWATTFEPALVAGSANPLISNGSFVLRTNISLNLTNYQEIAEPTSTKGVEVFIQEMKRINAAKPDALLCASYSLEDSKVVGNRRIPTRFTAIRYLCAADGPQPPRPLGRWDVEVTNIITNTASIQPLLRIIGKFDVQDRRFMQRTENKFFDSMFYRLPETGWYVSTNDPFFKTDHGENIVRMNIRLSSKPRRAAYYLAAIAFVILAPLPVILYFLRKGNKTAVA